VRTIVSPEGGRAASGGALAGATARPLDRTTVPTAHPPPVAPERVLVCLPRVLGPRVCCATHVHRWVTNISIGMENRISKSVYFLFICGLKSTLLARQLHQERTQMEAQ